MNQTIGGYLDIWGNTGDPTSQFPIPRADRSCSQANVPIESPFVFAGRPAY